MAREDMLRTFQEQPVYPLASQTWATRPVWSISLWETRKNADAAVPVVYPLGAPPR